MIPYYRFYIDEENGVSKMSLVEAAAVDVDFLKFSKESAELMRFTADEEKHIVFGVAMRPNFAIYRNDFRGEYYVEFDADTVRKCAEQFMRDGHIKDVNLNHSVDTDGVYMIQSFIKDTSKGISPVGFEDIEDGAWFAAYKVEDDTVWNEVKAGKFNGFSVEISGWLEPKDELEDLIHSLLD